MKVIILNSDSCAVSKQVCDSRETCETGENAFKIWEIIQIIIKGLMNRCNNENKYKIERYDGLIGILSQIAMSRWTNGDSCSCYSKGISGDMLSWF